jgi:hypothetical protein
LYPPFLASSALEQAQVRNEAEPKAFGNNLREAYGALVDFSKGGNANIQTGNVMGMQYTLVSNPSNAMSYTAASVQ